MDVLWFLQQRVGFIRQLYETASAPYTDRKAKIESEEEPYVPPHSEDSEPAFLSEWLEAEESLQALGYSCLSMLAASMHLYFKTWEREARHPIDASLNSVFSKKGWLEGYRRHFSERLGIDLKSGPVEFDLLHEIVLARNRIQHVESIVHSRATFSDSDLQKVKHPFFLNEFERGFFTEPEADSFRWFMEPSVHVTQEKLLSTLDAVLKFGEWFEEQACRRRFSS